MIIDNVYVYTANKIFVKGGIVLVFIQNTHWKRNTIFQTMITAENPFCFHYGI